ncbi:MAG: TonB-dependent receptor [Ignavibacteriae bacterium]|nr:TonB-dependent receptor [Ignavibacteriota bacterium]
MRYLLFALTVILGLTSNLLAQEKGGISGKIVDKMNQQPVIGAVIEVVGAGLKSGSDDNGYYYLETVPTGRYSLRFTSIGYQLFVVDNVVVNSGVITDVRAELDIIAVDEIVVEDERFTKPGDISSSFKNLSSQEIRTAPGGFEDVGRVVQTLPGVAYVNDGRNDLIVRGGAPSENLFIVDNAYVPNINHFGSQGATGGPVSIIDLGFIREVNFITGGFSAKYGDKLSSVLEIKQREGSRIKFMTDLNLSATGFGAVLEGPIGSQKKGSWLVSARRSYLDFIFNAAGFGFVPEYYSLQGKGVYDLDKRNYLTLNFISNLDKVKFNNTDEKKKQDNSVIIGSDQSGYVFGAEWKSLLSSKAYSLFNLTRTYTNFNYTGTDVNGNVYFTNKSKEGETSLKGEYYLQALKTGQFTAGIEGKLVNFKNEIRKDTDTLYYINPETNSRYILDAVNLNDNEYTYKASAFAQWTQFFANRFKVNVGLRYDYFDYINTKGYLSPRASAQVTLLHDFYLNLSYGIFYQTPSYVWLVTNTLNKNLEDIRADHYVAGLEYIIMPDLKASVEVYYKKYDKYPVSTTRPYFILSNSGGSFDTQNDFGLEPLVSAGTGNSRGIEFYVQKTLSNNYYFNINLSLFNAKYKSLDGIERSSDFDNKVLFTAFGGYQLKNNWTVAGKFRFAGGRPYTPINPVDGTLLVSEYNSARLPDYYSLDIRVEKKWNFAKWTLNTYIDIQDITGKKNVTAYKWNKFTRQVETQNSIGVLPTIGINAMF